MDKEQLELKIKELEGRIAKLETRRIIQQDILPGVIKTRHMGEANRYIIAGLAVNLPTGVDYGESTLMFYATDTDVLYIWDGTAWQSH